MADYLVVFTGTWATISHLFSYLKTGWLLAELLPDYPTVEEEQANYVLDAALATLLPLYLRVEPIQIDFSYTGQPHKAAA